MGTEKKERLNDLACLALKMRTEGKYDDRTL